MQQEKTPWYQKTGIIILFLIIFFPIGLFLMYKYANWKLWVKLLITIIITCMIIVNFTQEKTDMKNGDNQVSKSDQNDNKDSNNKNKSKSNDNKDSSNETKSKPVDKLEKSNYKIGDTLKFDKIEVTILDKSTAKSVGTPGLEKNANGEYLILDVTVKNNSNKPVNISDSFFKLINGSKEFQADGSASLSANQAISPDNLGFFGEKINPESKKQAKIVFDVNQNVITQNNLMLQVQSGLFGTEKEKVSLN